MGELFNKNEELLNKIEQLLKERGEAIVRDGLLHRGDIIYKGGYWNRRTGHEEDLWKNIPLKILFLMKDYTNDDMPDIRTETMRRNHIAIDEEPMKRDAFSMNILYWLFGLTHTNNKIIQFTEIEEGHNCFSFYEKYPLARINCKKNPGKSWCPISILNSYLNDRKYSTLLSEQIKLYNADIILCCGGSSKIKNYVKRECYKDLEQINNWMFYSSSENKLIIDSYHPSYPKIKRSITNQWLYEELMNKYYEFVQSNEIFYNKIVKMMEYEEATFPTLSYSIIEEK